MVDQNYLIAALAVIPGLIFMVGYIIGSVVTMWFNHRNIEDVPIYFR